MFSTNNKQNTDESQPIKVRTILHPACLPPFNYIDYTKICMTTFL